MQRYFLWAVAVICIITAPFIGGKAEAAEFDDRVSDMTEITDLRVSVQDSKVRLVLDSSKVVQYESSALSNPGRIVIDIPNAWLSPKVPRSMRLSSRFATAVRVAQYNKTTVRVVVETELGKGQYKLFTLEGGASPGRLVMDFGSAAAPKPVAETKSAEETTKPAAEVKESGSAKKETDITQLPEGVPVLDGPVSEQEAETPKDKDKESGKETYKEPDEKSLDKQIEGITGLKGRTITLDAGHGGSDSGAIGPSGVMEKTITLNVALEAKRLLEEEGATVYMTRTKDVEVSPKRANASDVEELQARCDVANNRGSDIFISIHMDSFSSSSAQGTTSYYYAGGSRQSMLLADKIRIALIEELKTSSRGTRDCNFYVVKHTDMPATLLELAFISNPDEERLLNSKQGIQKAAQAIVDGIADYFG